MEYWGWEPSINGTSDSIEHIYKKTGIYPLTLTVRNADGSETNMIERKVYVTDTNNPFSLIDVTNSSNTIIDDPVVCGDGGAFICREIVSGKYNARWFTLD